jgi:hypothetical protein
VSATNRQIGGDHYRNLPTEPVVFIRGMIELGLWGWDESNAFKYLCRWRRKNGIEDLEKARHYIDLLIESEKAK